MKIYAPKVTKKAFEIPPEGPVLATLVEVQDKGLVSTGWGSKPKIILVWQTNLLASDGKTAIKVFEHFTNTLHPMGKLAPRIKSLTGEFPDPDEEYCLSDLEGIKATIVIEHNVTEEGTYANVVAVIREKTPEEAAEEKRVKRVVAAVRKKDDVASYVASDSDVPF